MVLTWAETQNTIITCIKPSHIFLKGTTVGFTNLLAIFALTSANLSEEKIINLNKATANYIPQKDITKGMCGSFLGSYETQLKGFITWLTQ